MLLTGPLQEPGAEETLSGTDPGQPSPPTVPHASSGAACSGPTDPGLGLLGAENHTRPGSPRQGEVRFPPSSSAAQPQPSSWVKFLLTSSQEKCPEQAVRARVGAPAGPMASLLLLRLQRGFSPAGPVLPHLFWEPVSLLTPPDLWGPSEKSHTGLWGRGLRGVDSQMLPRQALAVPFGGLNPQLQSQCLFGGAIDRASWTGPPPFLGKGSAGVALLGLGGSFLKGTNGCEKLGVPAPQRPQPQRCLSPH